MRRLCTLGWIAASSATLAIAANMARAGDLNPPAGPVAPTMKNLDLVEPRIPLSQSTTPGDADSTFRITKPGSYYLTARLDGEVGKKGIEIFSNDVTIDLNGFTLLGVPGSLDGIGRDTSFFNPSRVVISDGNIVGWGAKGINGIGLNWSVVLRVLAANNASYGIEVNAYSIVDSCISANNGTIGIRANRSCLIQNCIATFNGTDGINVNFINQVRNCSSTLSGADGFHTGIGNIIEHNLAESNAGDGFDLFHANTVRDNYAYRNGSGNFNTGAGFFTNDDKSTFEGNSAVDNDRGFYVLLGDSNLLVRNRAINNRLQGAGGLLNYVISGVGNAVGPQVTSANIAFSTNSHANYSQ